MRFRWLHRLYAAAFGYFWLDCPCCGQCFGGHEWRDRDGKIASIPCGECDNSGHRIGICPSCTRAGIGYEN